MFPDKVDRGPETEFVHERVKILPERETACYQHFLLLSTFLPKAFFFRVINPVPNKQLVFTCLLKTLWEKENLLVMSNFSFSRNVFYLLGELSAIFIKFEIVICKIFQFERV